MTDLIIKREFKASKIKLIKRSNGFSDFWFCEISDKAKEGYMVQVFGPDKQGLEQIKARIIKSLNL